jgi:hypothetical protein
MMGRCDAATRGQSLARRKSVIDPQASAERHGMVSAASLQNERLVDTRPLRGISEHLAHLQVSI